MNIHTHNFSTRPLGRFQSQVSSTSSQETTLSQDVDTFATTRKAVGGAVAGTLFSGLLASLPVSLIPAFGGTAQTAGRVIVGTMVAGGLAGGFFSATMPQGKNWY